MDSVPGVKMPGASRLLRKHQPRDLRRKGPERGTMPRQGQSVTRIVIEDESLDSDLGLDKMFPAAL